MKRALWTREFTGGVITGLSIGGFVGILAMRIGPVMDWFGFVVIGLTALCNIGIWMAWSAQQRIEPSQT